MAWISDWVDAWQGSAIDWGSASWSSDIAAAAAQARTWIDATADARGWSDPWRDTADAAVLDALGWGFGSVQDFWADLAALWNGQTGGPAGWTELGAAFSSAAGTALQGHADVGSAVAEDLLEKAATAIDPRRSVWPWVAAVVVGAALWIKFGKR